MVLIIILMQWYPVNIWNLIMWELFWKREISRQVIRITEVCYSHILSGIFDRISASLLDIWHRLTSVTWDDRTNCKTRRHLVWDLRVKTRHSWIHQVHSTRNCEDGPAQCSVLSVVVVVAPGWQQSQSVSQCLMLSLQSLNLSTGFSSATYTDCGPAELMLGW